MAKLFTKRQFCGFSTSKMAAKKRRNSALFDIELIKEDLLNLFHTRPGDRLMRPTIGCKIWDYLMEQFTDATRDAIVAEVERVCRSDDRLDVANIQVATSSHSITVTMTLIYRPYDLTENFRVKFEQRQN